MPIHRADGSIEKTTKSQALPSGTSTEPVFRVVTEEVLIPGPPGPAGREGIDGTSATFAYDDDGRFVVTAPGLHVAAAGADGMWDVDRVNFQDVAGDNAWHTVYTVSPTLDDDEIVFLSVLILLRMPAGTPGGTFFRRKIAVQNNSGTLQTLSGAALADESIDTEPASPTLPSGGATRITGSGTTLIVQAKATVSCKASVDVDLIRRKAPGSVVVPIPGNPIGSFSPIYTTHIATNPIDSFSPLYVTH